MVLALDIVPSVQIAPDAVDPRHLMRQLGWRYASRVRTPQSDERSPARFDFERLDALLGLPSLGDGESPTEREMESERVALVAPGV